jgi:hypothetical protein
VAANEAGGIVSQRDFVVLNEQEVEESPLGKIYYVAYVSVEYPDRPPLEDFVRYVHISHSSIFFLVMNNNQSSRTVIFDMNCRNEQQIPVQFK